MKNPPKPDFQDRELPSSLESLPRFAITPARASTREQSARSDIAFGVRSMDDLFEAVKRGFADPGPPSPPGKLARK